MNIQSQHAAEVINSWRSRGRRAKNVTVPGLYTNMPEVSKRQTWLNHTEKSQSKDYEQSLYYESTISVRCFLIYLTTNWYHLGISDQSACIACADMRSRGGESVVFSTQRPTSSYRSVLDTTDVTYNDFVVSQHLWQANRIRRLPLEGRYAFTGQIHFANLKLKML